MPPSDQSGCTARNFHADVLEKQFLNEDYEVGLPPSHYYDAFPEDEKGKWEPNCPKIFEHERTGEWLKETWEK